jgi:hypothetical protein
MLLSGMSTKPQVLGAISGRTDPGAFASMVAGADWTAPDLEHVPEAVWKCRTTVEIGLYCERQR